MWVSFFALFMLFGCKDASDEPGDAAAGAGDAGVEARPVRELVGDCDPLVPDVCILPFPSDVYRVADASLPGGHRIEIPMAALPGATEPEAFRRSDGWSPAVPAVTFMPGATVTGLPTPDTIEASLEQASPTVIMETATGERVPHFSELDMSHDDAERRVLMVRPVVTLKANTRYVVAIRNVVDADGTVLEPSEAFAALRDESASDDPDVEAARPLYDQLFGLLARHGVERDSLQIAWDFTTATRENTTEAMLHMRDEALAAVGSQGPSFEITSVIDDPDEHTARRIDGEIEVPLYLQHPDAGSMLVYGDDGLPVAEGTARYPFLVLIPNSARDSAKPPLAIGHGLLGNQEQALGFTAFADEYGYVLFALDWIGMASDDVGNIISFLSTGEAHRFESVADRLRQGFLNFLLATRMMTGDLASVPETQLDDAPAIDPSEPFYYGGSQGGIYGASVMAISTDFNRGVLGVPGQPYSLLLNRSVNFDMYLGIMHTALPDPIDVQMAILLTQMLWDRAEPSGYSRHIRSDLLPNTPPHEVLMIVALGDQQVSTLGAHIMARDIGASLVQPAVREVFGLPITDPPFHGSAIVEIDFGNPPDPITNVPPREGSDPHGRPAQVEAVAQQVSHFLKTGEVVHFCEGPCDPD